MICPIMRASVGGNRDWENYVYGDGGSLQLHKATSVQAERQMAESFSEVFGGEMEYGERLTW